LPQIEFPAAILPQSETERNFMVQFSWTEDLHTGNSLIDGDHVKLIKLVNALFASMETGEGIAKAMKELIAYTGEHFAREEAEMERIEYVAFLAHKAEHVKLMKQIIELEEMLDVGGRINSPAVSHFLDEWLRHHILTDDMKLAAALARQAHAQPASHLH
jgi:hemerythrin-like metal-binding protein